MRHQVIERTIFQQQLGRRFRTYLLHTRHVVHGIAHQNLIVQHEAGRDTKLFLHPSQVSALAVHGVDDGDVLVDQLGQVFVTAGHYDFDAMR